MSLTMSEVGDLSRSIARELAGAFQVAAVTTTDGGSERAEIVVSIEGCHDGPCRFMVNVTRSDRSAFEHELRTKLHEALDRHGRE
jgi:hypothetical protein